MQQFRLSVRCSPSSRLMVYFLLLMVSNFRVHVFFGNFMIHDFFEAVGFSFLPRQPPPWGWCGLAFFFVDPQGLPLFLADPLDITILTWIFLCLIRGGIYGDLV